MSPKVKEALLVVAGVGTLIFAGPPACGGFKRYAEAAFEWAEGGDKITVSRKEWNQYIYDMTCVSHDEARALGRKRTERDDLLKDNDNIFWFAPSQTPTIRPVKP